MLFVPLLVSLEIVKIIFEFMAELLEKFFRVEFGLYGVGGLLKLAEFPGISGDLRNLGHLEKFLFFN